MSDEIEEQIITRLVEKRYVLAGTDILHREDGPALIRYHGNGEVWEGVCLRKWDVRLSSGGDGRPSLSIGSHPRR